MPIMSKQDDEYHEKIIVQPAKRLLDSLKQTHTPGPWEYKMAKRPNGSERSMDFGILGGAGEIIAETFEKVGRTSEGQFVIEPAEANARLIAAAPDLLEALKFVLENPMSERGVDMAKQAIKKAEG